MFGLDTFKHKRTLTNAFSDCFDPVRSVYGNVPAAMKSSRYVTASLLGVCRAYATKFRIKEKTFDVIVDAVFEEVFRQDSTAVQTQTEAWLQGADAEFMRAYYDAKKRFESGLQLDWLTDYTASNFGKAREVYHST